MHREEEGSSPLASRIPQNIIDRIMEVSNIVDVISESVFLKQAGRNFAGLCPFHTEKTPSFTVSPDKQIYYCFGCGEGGNIFSFLVKHEGLSFPESVSTIGNRYGIRIPTKHVDEQEQKSIAERETISAINFDAMTFFHQNLVRHKNGTPAKSYLQRRGTNNRTIDEFKIGYAFAKWHSLEKHLKKKGWGETQIEISELIIVKKNKNISYDRFRNRIVFPIFNAKNSIIAFGARVIDNSQPKYLNSPESVIYSKSESLYGINIAKEKCRKTKSVFVVEGYIDLISLHQFGIKNSVATLGTSITMNHVRQIKRLIGDSGKVTLVYDSDQAGIKAAYRSLIIFQKEMVNVKIMILPTGYDPDSFIMEFGPKKFVSDSKKSLTALSFMINLGIDRNGLSINGKIKIISELKYFLATNTSELSRTLSIQRLAERIGVDELLIQREVNKEIKRGRTTLRHNLDKDHPQNITQIKNKTAFSKTYRLERKILMMILQFPDIIEIAERKNIINITNRFENESLKNIANLTINTFINGKYHLSNVIGECSNEEEKSVVAELALTQEKWNRKDCLLLIKQFEDAASRENDDLMKKITKAEQNGNTELLCKLLKEKQILARTTYIGTSKKT